MIESGKPALVLAPMEGVTDAPMRALQAETGAFSYCVTEFLRIAHQVPPRRTFLSHVPELNTGSRTPSGVPVHVQLLGGDPDLVAEAAGRACELGALAVDLNFGCPAPTVNRHDGGAVLLRYPDRLRQIVRRVRERVPKNIPVSAKLRLGWDDPRAIFRNAEEVILGGASWITIHGRTKEQGYRPPAFWEPIGLVRAMSPIPVVANGDIWTLDDFRRCREETGCEHFMIGRGALANPLLPHQIAFELGLFRQDVEKGLEAPHEWIPWLGRLAYWSEGYPYPSSHYLVRRMKQWLRFAYAQGRAPWFESVKRCETYDDFMTAMRTA